MKKCDGTELVGGCLFVRVCVCACDDRNAVFTVKGKRCLSNIFRVTGEMASSKAVKTSI